MVTGLHCVQTKALLRERCQICVGEYTIICEINFFELATI